MKIKSLDEIERELLFSGKTPAEESEISLTEVSHLNISDNGAIEISLNGIYQMIDGGDSIPDFLNSVEANVPCTVQTALFEAGKIPDPMYAKNDKFAREEAYKIWWFKKEFDYDGSLNDPHLYFSGVCHRASFYLNGVFLGEHTGMFGGPDFAVGDLLKGHNILIVKIENSPTDRKKYSEYADYDEGWRNGVVVNCVYGWHYACIPSRGIWADVSLQSKPRCEFERPFILTEDYSTGKMGICLRSFGNGNGKIKIAVSPANFVGDTQYFTTDFICKKGQRLHYTLKIKNPKLWWPNGYGEQSLYKFVISIENENDLIQTFEETVGIRQIEMRPIGETANPEWYNWRFYINGKYIFIKGTNWCTTDALLRCTEKRYDRFLELAKHENLQLLRAWGGGLPESDYFYKKCDELGLMVQQEWPTCWESPETQPCDALVETARIHTVRLRNHPSLVRWAGGNELMATDEPSVREMASIAFELDGSRPFHRTSPYAGSLHNYDTYWGMKEMDISLNLRAPFIGEFGMASCPNIESVARYVPQDELEDKIDRAAKNVFNYHTPRFNEMVSEQNTTDMDNLLLHAKDFVDVKNIKDFVFGTQMAQIVAIRHTLEAQRADTKNAAGICYYKFTDVYPACSWSTVDYYGVPKIPYYAFKNAFEPVHAMLSVNSITAAEEYPVILLDDIRTVSGHKCKVCVSAYDNKLIELQNKEFNFMPNNTVEHIGVFKLDADLKKQVRIIAVKLWVDDVLYDDTFYMFNYKEDVGCYTRLPKAELSIRAEGSYAVVENNSDVLAVGVFVENLEHDTEFIADSNFFCLAPHEKREIKVSHTEGISVRAFNFSR
ncbi:MAG: hypothetical protein E7521_01345 [Ruminococcaceae bacterium]|nr:hypothetical protein [Oscillospiraceae bacterium]